MVGGSIDGYYDLKRMAIASNKGGTNLRLSLGTYHPLGTKWVQIYRTKMQPGELISLEKTLEMYGGASRQVDG